MQCFSKIFPRDDQRNLTEKTYAAIDEAIVFYKARCWSLSDIVDDDASPPSSGAVLNIPHDDSVANDDNIVPSNLDVLQKAALLEEYNAHDSSQHNSTSTILIKRLMSSRRQASIKKAKFAKLGSDDDESEEFIGIDDSNTGDGDYLPEDDDSVGEDDHDEYFSDNDASINNDEIHYDYGDSESDE